jgi:antirestriction protein
MNNQAFFYIDGIPTKGLWVDMDEVTEWEQVEEKLLDLFPTSQIDEILCADVEGLARHFYASNCDSFSMTEWADFKEELDNTHLDASTVDAYLENCGIASIDTIEDSYVGEYNNWEDFAYNMADECGYLDQMPPSIRAYFDYEAFGRDLSHDFFESNGHFFRNC